MPLDYIEKKLLYRVVEEKDPEAFGRLYDHYINKIYRFIYFKVKSKEDAEDVVSEVFLKTWNYLTQSGRKQIKSFSGLVYKIARNTLIDHYRKLGSKPEISLDMVLEVADHADRYQEIDTHHEAQKILAVLKKMKREYQEVLLLRYIEELSVAEIAIILEKGQVAVRVTLHRAIKVAKNLLNKNKDASL